MGGATMELQLKMDGVTKLQESEMSEIDTFVEEIINKHKLNTNMINTLVLDSVATLSVAEARSDELSSQGKLKRFWNGLTGKNNKIRAEIDKNLSSAQYASQQMIQKLAEQNLLSFELITTVNNKLNTMITEVEEEVNRVYETLIIFFKQVRSNVVQLESRVEKLEQNVNLLHWHNTIEYQIIDGVEYSELRDMEKVVCLVNDFYHLTKGNWSTADLMLLKATMTEVGLHVKEEIFYKDFFECVFTTPLVMKKLLGESSIERAINIEPYQASLIKGIEKYIFLQNEEKFTIEAVMALTGNADKEDIVFSMIHYFLKGQAFLDIEKSVNIFDFVNELLLNLEMFHYNTSLELEVKEDLDEKVKKYQKIIKIKNKQISELNNKYNIMIGRRKLVRVAKEYNEMMNLYILGNITLTWNKKNGELVSENDTLGWVNYISAGSKEVKIFSPSGGRLYILKENKSVVEDGEIVAVIADPSDDIIQIRKWIMSL